MDHADKPLGTYATCSTCGANNRWTGRRRTLVSDESEGLGDSGPSERHQEQLVCENGHVRWIDVPHAES
jgi:hypothetical protein